MQLTMPSNDDNMTEQDKSVTKADQTITIYLASDDKVFYIEGLPNYEDPTCVKETTWGRDGLRKVLISHTTGEGIAPVARIMKAKQQLDEEKTAYGSTMTEEEYQKQLTEIRNGNLKTGKVPTMTVVIKPLDTASYNNMVGALDEMQICTIGKYVIDKINPDDEKLLALRGVK